MVFYILMCALIDFCSYCVRTETLGIIPFCPFQGTYLGTWKQEGRLYERKKGTRERALGKEDELRTKLNIHHMHFIWYHTSYMTFILWYLFYIYCYVVSYILMYENAIKTFYLNDNWKIKIPWPTYSFFLPWWQPHLFTFFLFHNVMQLESHNVQSFLLGFSNFVSCT